MHEIVKCSRCDRVIRQCKCPGPHSVNYQVGDCCKEWVAQAVKRYESAISDLLYFADCQLATVAGLAMKKTSAKCDRERHIAIAATMLMSLWSHDVRENSVIRRNRAAPLLKRMESSVSAKQAVTEWAEHLRKELA